MFSRSKKKVALQPNDFEFQQKYSLEHRTTQSEKIRGKFPTRIPMIIEPANRKTVRQIEKTKFLIPEDYHVSRFLNMLRSKVTLLKDQAIFIFLENNTIPPANETMSRIYENHKNEDGFLYVHYTTENTFGCH